MSFGGGGPALAILSGLASGMVERDKRKKEEEENRILQQLRERQQRQAELSMQNAQARWETDRQDRIDRDERLRNEEIADRLREEERQQLADGAREEDIRQLAEAYKQMFPGKSDEELYQIARLQIEHKISATQFQPDRPQQGRAPSNAEMDAHKQGQVNAVVAAYHAELSEFRLPSQVAAWSSENEVPFDIAKKAWEDIRGAEYNPNARRPRGNIGGPQVGAPDTAGGMVSNDRDVVGEIGTTLRHPGMQTAWTIAQDNAYWSKDPPNAAGETALDLIMAEVELEIAELMAQAGPHGTEQDRLTRAMHIFNMTQVGPLNKKIIELSDLDDSQQISDEDMSVFNRIRYELTRRMEAAQREAMRGGRSPSPRPDVNIRGVR